MFYPGLLDNDYPCVLGTDLIQRNIYCEDVFQDIFNAKCLKNCRSAAMKHLKVL